MGYINQKLVMPHISNKGNICIKYPFINKNGESDIMYIGMSRQILDELDKELELRDNDF